MLTWNELTTRDELKKEYWNAANALDVAYNHFNNAEPMFIDAAVSEITAASMKMLAIKSKLKRMEDDICGRN